MQDKFQTMSKQTIGRTDDVRTHIDDLEGNIADLMTPVGRNKKWKVEPRYLLHRRDEGGSLTLKPGTWFLPAKRRPNGFCN